LKVVAVTMRQDPAVTRAETVDTLDARWADFLLRCGWAALPLPNCAAAAARLLERAAPEALLLTGGGDPACISGAHDVRDAVEGLAIDWAERHRLPIVGVCRGMQTLLARDGISWSPVDGHVGVEHAVDGRFARRVNSFHRYGVKGHELGPWQVVARAADGLVEAVEDASRHRAGVMWHPERMKPFASDDLELFTRWLANAAPSLRTDLASVPQTSPL
jgi:putative glutamine amidotransferase